jgi:glycosyltransferase involved in cell wall biosynthesis
MRIAFFNWRDIRHPMAGGAEVYVHEILRALAARGHVATLFSSRFPGSAEREVVDGIEHVRFGGRYSMYAKALFCYRRHIRGRYDVIVESINGVPFFTPLFAKERVVPLIHQLTRENWYSALPFPVAFAGYHLEDAMLRLYSRNTAVAVSQSTKSDLERIGFRDVRIIYGAAKAARPADLGKEAAPTLIYLGRLTKSKRVNHALRAFSALQKNVPEAKMWVAGSGPEESRLRTLAAELGISRSVQFFGKVSENRKAELLTRAHLVLFPAVREGWGLVVLEANACGTPAIGYDVPGLRDSIRAGINGFLVPDGDYDSIAEKAASLLSEPGRLGSLSASSAAYAKGFSWEKSAVEYEALFQGLLNGGNGRPGK